MAKIKVNMTTLQEKVATLQQSFQALEDATRKASLAGAKAVRAAGGPGTGAGAAVNETIRSVSDAQLKEARRQLDEMIADLNKAATEYSDKNANLISTIKAIGASSN